MELIRQLVKESRPVRFEGNNSKQGSARLRDSGLNIIAATSLTDAAQKAVAAAGAAR